MTIRSCHMVYKIATLMSAIAAMTIKATNTDQVCPSKVSATLDCQFLYSVSAHPPFFVMGVNASNTTESLKDTYLQIEERVPVQSSAQEQTAGSAKRGIIPEEPLPPLIPPGQVPDQSVDRSNRVVPLDYTYDWHQLQISAQRLYDRLRMLKIQLAKDSQRVEAEYSSFKARILGLQSRFTRLKEVAGSPPSELVRYIEDISTLCDMFELNKAMREQGCGDYLDSVLVQDAAGKILATTKLVILTNRLQELSGIISQCYDKHGKPKLVWPGLVEKITGVQNMLNSLRSNCDQLLVSNTPLGRIFDEDLLSVEEKLYDLNISAIAGVSQSSLHSEQWKAGSFKEAALEVGKSSQAPSLIQAQYRVIQALEDNPQKQDILNLDTLLNWRENLHRVCDEVYLQMVTFDPPESVDKGILHELLGEATRELSRKANSVILVTTIFTCDGKLENQSSLTTFSKLYRILKSDIAYNEKKLDGILRNLEVIQAGQVSDVQSVKEEVRINELLLKRVSSYISLSEWVHLPLARRIKPKEKSALATLELIKQSMVERVEV